MKKCKDSKLDNLIRNLLIKDPDNRYTREQYFNDKFLQINFIEIKGNN